MSRCRYCGCRLLDTSLTPNRPVWVSWHRGDDRCLAAGDYGFHAPLNGVDLLVMLGVLVALMAALVTALALIG